MIDRTYCWVFHAELATFVDKLVWAQFVPHRRDILINVMVRAEEWLEDFVFLASCVTPNPLLFATFTPAKHILLLKLHQFCLMLLLLELRGARPLQSLVLRLVLFELLLLN